MSKPFHGFIDYSHSTGVKQICLANIAYPLYSAFDYLFYPYYPALIPFVYHFVISVDNKRA